MIVPPKIRACQLHFDCQRLKGAIHKIQVLNFRKKHHFAMYRTCGAMTLKLESGITCSLCVLCLLLLVDWSGNLCSRGNVCKSPLHACFWNGSSPFVPVKKAINNNNTAVNAHRFCY